MSQPTITARVARNSLWFAVETVLLNVGQFGISLLVARALGPEKLGYYSYISLITHMTGGVASLGIPGATLKYMGEYLGAGDANTARSIFQAAMKMQVLFSTLVSILGLVLLWIWGEPAYFWVSAVQVVTLLPRMLAFVPSAANTAAEDTRANVFPSLLGTLFYIVIAILTVGLHWGTMGLAAGYFVQNAIEFAAKYRTVMMRLGQAVVAAIPAALRRKLLSFSGESAMIMLLQLLVWERSDILLLKALQPDIRQITFFSFAFNVVEKSLLLPTILMQGVSPSIFAQYGRDKTKLQPFVSAAFRYAMLVSLPPLVGLATVGAPLVAVFYGSRYQAVGPVLTILAGFGVSRILMWLLSTVLSATDRQRASVAINVVALVINVAVDWWLIPTHGAVGAAIGSGAAQFASVPLFLWLTIGHGDLKIDVSAISRILLSNLAMVAAVVPLSVWLPPWASLPASLFVGPLVLAVSMRFLRVLKPEDRQRLEQLQHRLPGPMRGLFQQFLRFMAV